MFVFSFLCEQQISVPFVNAAAPSVGDRKVLHFHKLNVMLLVRARFFGQMWPNLPNISNLIVATFHSVGNLVFHFQVAIK